MKAEAEKAELDQIRRLLDLPIEKRTHFLRRRIGFGWHEGHAYDVEITDCH